MVVQSLELDRVINLKEGQCANTAILSHSHNTNLPLLPPRLQLEHMMTHKSSLNCTWPTLGWQSGNPPPTLSAKSGTGSAEAPIKESSSCLSWTRGEPETELESTLSWFPPTATRNPHPSPTSWLGFLQMDIGSQAPALVRQKIWTPCKVQEKFHRLTSGRFSPMGLCYGLVLRPWLAYDMNCTGTRPVGK